MELLHLTSNKNTLHCPYNLSHTMPHKTFIKHLIRCPDKPSHFRSCTFNMSHVMPDYEIEDHETNCPNRILLDSVVYQSEDMVRPVPIIENVPDIDYSTEESWEGLEQTSDVLSVINKTRITMKAIHNTTKSERKKHRALLHISHMNELQNIEREKALNLQSGSTGPGCIENINNWQKNDKQKRLFIGKRPAQNK